jgi:pyridoxine 5-phosphate synthase
MTRLSVNVNKIATLRNARGGNLPDVLLAAERIERFGAGGITVHPRPDARHITYADVQALRGRVTTEFNVEGYPSPDFIDLVCAVRPDQVTLVPDAPDALISDAGWDTVARAAALAPVIARLREAGIRVSLFVDPVPELISGAADLGADRIELYTGPYAEAYGTLGAEAALPFARAAAYAHSLGLGVNAGHDLNLHNLRDFASHVPHLAEVSIGHALISDALYLGLSNAVASYLACLRPAMPD